MPHPDQRFCDCINWAREAAPFITKHHPQCVNYAPLQDAREVIVSLLDLLDELEEGIPVLMVDTYNFAALRVGRTCIREGE